jgi:hypothetical protein
MTACLPKMAFKWKLRRVSWRKSVTKIQKRKKKSHHLYPLELAAHQGHNLGKNSLEGCPVLPPYPLYH